MPKNNNPYYIPSEIKKPIEIVHKLKDKKEYQIPSFEEFMKTYENDENLNYDDLRNDDIGTPKVCGPSGR